MTKKYLIILVFLLCFITGCSSKDHDFSDGYAIVYKDRVAYLLNNKNETFEIEGYQTIDTTFGKRILVTKEKGKKFLYGYIDNNGIEVIKPTYEKAYPFSEGLAVVVKKGQYHIINEDNKIVYTFPDNAKSYDVFTNGYLRVEINGQYTFLNKNFEIGNVFFENIENFNDGYALASKQDENGNISYFFVNEQLEVVLDSDKLKEYDFVDSVHEGFIRVGRTIDDTYYYSYIDINGNLLIDENGNSNYLKADNFHSGYTIIYTGKPYEMVSSTSKSGRYSFQYMAKDGTYPKFNYNKYNVTSETPVGINSFIVTFKRFVGDIVSIKTVSNFTIFNVVDGKLQEIKLFSNNKNLSKLDEIYYQSPINLLSMKYNNFYINGQSTLLMVFKIRTNYYGIVNASGEYITDAIYDNVII